MVGGLLIRERGLKLRHPGRVRIEGRALHDLPPRLGFQQRPRQVENGAFRRRLLFRPARSTQLVQRDAVSRDADIPAEQVRLRDGNV